MRITKEIQAVRPDRSGAQPLAQLDDLLADTFGFNLANWRIRGLWPDDYTCYTIFADGAALANAGVYRMEMLLGGRPRVCYQIGAVATRLEHRGQGHSQRILEHILAQHPGETFFLLANPNVLEFYPRFGFRPVETFTPRLRLPEPNTPQLPAGELYQLAVDDPAVAAYLNGPAQRSNVLDCTNAAPLHAFHLLMEYPDSLFEISDLQALLVLDIFGDSLTLVDFWSPNPLDFATLAPSLPLIGIREVRFGFNPDRLGLQCKWFPDDEAPLFVRGDFPIPAPFTMPLMLRT